MEGIPYLRVVLTALPLLAFIVNLSFGVFMFRRRKLLVNRLFALLMFSFCWWNIGEFALRLANARAQAILIMKIVNIATPCIPSIALMFVMALENKRPSRRQIAFMILAPLVFIFMSLAGWLVSDVALRFDVYMLPEMSFSLSNGYIYFTAYMTAFTSYVIYRLFMFYKKCENELVKRRIRYMIAGVLITSFITFITEFLVPLILLHVGIDLPSLGSFSTIFLTSLTYYSVRGRG